MQRQACQGESIEGHEIICPVCTCLCKVYIKNVLIYLYFVILYCLINLFLMIEVINQIKSNMSGVENFCLTSASQPHFCILSYEFGPLEGSVCLFFQASHFF